MAHPDFSPHNRKADEFSQKAVDEYRQWCIEQSTGGTEDPFRYSAGLPDEELRETMAIQEMLLNDPQLQADIAAIMRSSS